MRHVDLDQLELPDGWKDKARKALDEVSALPPGQRADGINARAPIWQELKDALKKLSHDKCWYCESKRLRSDDAVDHFRPKNHVAECPAHEGYWWLAFDWQNYRFSCTYCNSKRKDKSRGNAGGKQDHFPIVDESKRAYCESDSTDDEYPFLLDPADDFDVTLLWFREDGMAVPSRGDVDSFRQRVEISIDLYHLNHTETVERRILLYNQIKKLVKEGKYQLDCAIAGDVAALRAYKLIVESLRDLRKAESEFSRASNAYLMGLRGTGNEWLETIFA